MSVESQKHHLIEPKALLQGSSILVVALAWNEFGRRTLEKFKPHANPGYTMLWAFLVTVVMLIMISIWNGAVGIYYNRRLSVESIKSGDWIRSGTA